MSRTNEASCSLLVTTVFFTVATLASGASGSTADGWYELDSSPSPAPNTTTAAPGAAVSGRGGDRFWMARAGDTFESISAATTGSASHADAIAAYNRVAAGTLPEPDTLLFVPAALLTPPRGVVEPVRSEIRELEAVPAPVPVVAPPGAPTSRVDDRDIDMFAGEVQVFGTFDATRVAIGNGAIVRAEVLAGGELLVIAQSPGSTSLRLWNRDGSQTDFNVRVGAEDPVTRVRMEKMVRMRVRMVEFRKSALGRLGIDWSDATSGPTFAAAGDAIGNNLFRPPSGEAFGRLPNTVQPFSTYFGIASNITSRINFLASNGDAVTLAEPVLSTTNGGTASFLAGGEVPYPAIGQNGQTVVQFKEYGIKLNVSPVVDAGGNVRTVVETEISQLDPAVSVQGAPGLLTRRAETVVNVRSGETIVISGLLSAESSKDIDRIPGIGRLPVIGSLFRSKNTRNAVSELVIFVTPEIVDPLANILSAREREVLDRTSARLERERSDLPLME